MCLACLPPRPPGPHHHMFNRMTSVTVSSSLSQQHARLQLLTAGFCRRVLYKFAPQLSVVDSVRQHHGRQQEDSTRPDTSTLSKHIIRTHARTHTSTVSIALLYQVLCCAVLCCAALCCAVLYAAIRVCCLVCPVRVDDVPPLRHR